jgi:GntR family transcriptional repressor for pyruvate dehydrogenase complex
MSTDAAQPDAGTLAPLPRSQRLSDRVAERMLAAILEHRLAAGSHLPSERELGEQFGVSRTVIREATRLLVAKGVLDVRPGTGLTVAAADPASVAESMNLFLRNGGIPYHKIHEVRTMIEVQVAGLAAERGTEAQIAELAAIHGQFARLTDGDDLETLAVTDVQFHRQLARMTSNELLLLMLDSIGDVLLEIRRQTVANRDDSRRAIDAHRRVLDRVAARDAAGARAAMQAHLDQAYAEWVRLGRPVGVPQGSAIGRR